MARIPFSLALAVAVSTTTAVAQPHGRFPGAGLVAVEPADPDHIVLRTTYGLVSTLDGGATWSWTCGTAAGYDADALDPSVAIASDGAVVLGHFGGLYRSARDGCDYQPAPNLAGRFVVDLVREDASRLLALSSNGQAGGTFEVELWASSDGGASWTALAVDLPETFLGQSVTAAPSRPERIYVGGRDGPQGTVMRSDDRGVTWESLPVPGTEPNTVPLVLAVAPDDPETFFVAYRQGPGGDEDDTHTLLWTSDGGDSWTTLYEGPDALAGFTLAPDGSQVAFGGPELGLRIANRATLPDGFTTVHPLRVQCLAWEPSGLYACADPFQEPFNLGLSTDGGASFSGLSELTSPCGPPACGPDTSVGSTCPAEWAVERVELRACGFGETSSASSGGSTPPTPPPASEDGCGCRLAGQLPERDRLAPWALVLFGLLARRRRSIL